MVLYYPGKAQDHVNELSLLPGAIWLIFPKPTILQELHQDSAPLVASPSLPLLMVSPRTMKVVQHSAN